MSSVGLLSVEDGAGIQEKQPRWQLWLQHPLFWAGALSWAFSVYSFLLAATWVFWFGMLCSVLLATVALAGVAVATRSWFGKLLRRKYWLITGCWLAILAVLLWRVALLVQIRLKAPDHIIRTFPAQCRPPPSPQDPVEQNCSILSKLKMVRVPGLTPPAYNASIAQVLDYYESVIMEGVFDDRRGSKVALGQLLSCQIIHKQDDLLHARCLTSFLGFPDDLVVGVHCEQGKAVASVYSQSRLGFWDWQLNEQRVRLLVEAQFLPFVEGRPEGGSC